jgi:hypothetical protein
MIFLVNLDDFFIVVCTSFHKGCGFRMIRCKKKSLFSLDGKMSFVLVPFRFHVPHYPESPMDTVDDCGAECRIAAQARVVLPCIDVDLGPCLDGKFFLKKHCSIFRLYLTNFV